MLIKTLKMKPVRGDSPLHVETIRPDDIQPFNTMGATCTFDFEMDGPFRRHMDLTLSAYAGRALPGEEPPAFTPEMIEHYKAILALVQAAPALLDALQVVLETCEPASATGDAAMAIAREVIAQAKGE